jgi:hypothetical protein
MAMLAGGVLFAIFIWAQTLALLALHQEPDDDGSGHGSRRVGVLDVRLGGPTLALTSLGRASLHAE